MTTYRIEFDPKGNLFAVPPLTITEDDPNVFARAVAAYAIPHLTPVVTEMGHPELADCFFRTNRERTYGEFMWVDLASGHSVRFCPARLTLVEAEGAEETHVVADDSDDPEHVDDCPGCVPAP